MHAVMLCDEDEALRLAASNDVSSVDRRSGFTVLHAASQFGLVRLVKKLVERGASLEARSLDLVLQHQIVQSGGQTPLHVAAFNGETAVVEALVALGADKKAIDWDGATPGVVALVRGHARLAARLGGGDPTLAIETQKLRANALSTVPDHLRRAYVQPRVLSRDECDRVTAAVVSTVAHRGFLKDRHTNHATTDIEASSVHSIDEWLRGVLSDRLFPTFRRKHGYCDVAFRDLFFVLYERDDQSGLDLHRDATPLSLNILLNRPEDFDGGGTFIEADEKVYAIDQGDCLVHSGKLAHAGMPVTRGHRFLLVAFVDVLDKNLK